MIEMKTTSNIVAMAYDFDGTLAPGNMQEHVFLPSLGIEPAEFWKESNELAKQQQGDKILTYMHKMLSWARFKDVPMRRSDWVERGKGIALFPGVEDWFSRINKSAEEKGLYVEHYIISSGLRELIEGTNIRLFIKSIFASGFLYDASSVAVGPAIAVNYTTKTQYLFRINKGALDLSDDKKVNAWQAPNARPVPFSNMIFIGDGETDIPCFRLVKEQGGHSIAVFPEGDLGKEEAAKRLISEGRVHCAVPANYSPGCELEQRVLAVFDLLAARKRVTADFRRDAE
ncbi:MAG: HAD family hydrolase [Acetobacteraceae bacterium]